MVKADWHAWFQASAARSTLFGGGGIFGSESWQVTTFRHKLSVPSTKDQAVKEEGFLDIMTLEDGADRLSQNVRHNYQHTLHTIPQDLRLMYTDNDGTDLFMMLWHSVPIAVNMKLAVHRDMTPFGLTGVYRRFGGNRCLRTHGRAILTTEARDSSESRYPSASHHTKLFNMDRSTFQ